MALPCGEELPYVFGTVYAAAASRNAPPFHVRGCRVTSFDHCARAQAPPFVLYTHTLFLARDVVVLEYRICTYCCQIHAPPPPLLFFFSPSHTSQYADCFSHLSEGNFRAQVGIVTRINLYSNSRIMLNEYGLGIRTGV